MKDSRLVIYSIVIIAAAVAVLLFAVFGTAGGNTPAVQLPPAASGADSGSSTADVTPQTVQAAISTLSRPDSYSRTLTTEDFWTGGSSSRKLQVWVSGSSTRIQSGSDRATENILLTSAGIWIWYDGVSGVWHSDGSDSSEADQWTRCVSYEELLKLDASKITGAGYAKYAGENCIWAEYSTPEFGYRNREYISVTTGILMGVETYDGDTLVYRMTSGAPSVTTQDASLFKIPEG
jgi:hypothetical protein